MCTSMFTLFGPNLLCAQAMHNICLEYSFPITATSNLKLRSYNIGKVAASFFLFIHGLFYKYILFYSWLVYIFTLIACSTLQFFVFFSWLFCSILLFIAVQQYCLILVLAVIQFFYSWPVLQLFYILLLLLLFFIHECVKVWLFPKVFPDQLYLSRAGIDLATYGLRVKCLDLSPREVCYFSYLRHRYLP